MSNNIIIRSAIIYYAAANMKSLIFFFEWHDKGNDIEDGHKVFNWEIFILSKSKSGHYEHHMSCPFVLYF